jgi:hypothetical protein
MADNLTPELTSESETAVPAMPRTLDEARAMARQRFKERFTNG